MTYCSKSILEDSPNFVYVREVSNGYNIKQKRARTFKDSEKSMPKRSFAAIGMAPSRRREDPISAKYGSAGSTCGEVKSQKRKEEEERLKSTHLERRESVGMAKPKPRPWMEGLLQVVAKDELLDRRLQQHQPRKDKTWAIFFEGQGLHQAEIQ
jgi:hypothetical protein